jgi:hypothetical protein
MKIISTRMHAIIDYLASVFFVASPWIFGFNQHVTATWILVATGVISIIMSLFTNYEGGLRRQIPMKTHLTTDIFFGTFLASSPWLFGFAQDIFLPHLLMGLFEASAGLLTSKHPSYHRMGNGFSSEADI